MVENFFSLIGFQTKVMFESQVYKIVNEMKVRSNADRGFFYPSGKRNRTAAHELGGEGFNTPSDAYEESDCRQHCKRQRVAHTDGYVKGEQPLRAL